MSQSKLTNLYLQVRHKIAHIFLVLWLFRQGEKPIQHTVSNVTCVYPEGRWKALSYSLNASKIYGSSAEIQSSDSRFLLRAENLQIVAFNKRKITNQNIAPEPKNEVMQTNSLTQLGNSYLNPMKISLKKRFFYLPNIYLDELQETNTRCVFIRILLISSLAPSSIIVIFSKPPKSLIQANVLQIINIWLHASNARSPENFSDGFKQTPVLSQLNTNEEYQTVGVI